MGNGTAIEWTHRPGTKGETWNPVVAWRTIADPSEPGGTRTLRGWHCEHASEGCRFCYAERQNVARARGGTGLAYKPGHRKDVRIEIHDQTLARPLHWTKPRTIFVCSMTDLFGPFVSEAMIDRVMAVAALSPQHTFIILTKRPERMRAYLTLRSWYAEAAFRLAQVGGATPPARRAAELLTRLQAAGAPLPNVWLGTSVEDQPTADERVPLLLDTPAAIRFVSAEPLLGPIDLTKIMGTTCLARDGACCGDRPWLDALRGIQGCSRAGAYSFPTRDQMPRGLDWVIVGGESGSRARPMHPTWARSLRDQCVAAGAPFFFKQWGEWARWEPGFPATAVDYFGTDGSHSSSPWFDREPMVRLGKAAAGRLLDGREWNEFPTQAEERAA